MKKILILNEHCYIAQRLIELLSSDSKLSKEYQAILPTQLIKDFDYSQKAIIELIETSKYDLIISFAYFEFSLFEPYNDDVKEYMKQFSFYNNKPLLFFSSPIANAVTASTYPIDYSTKYQITEYPISNSVQAVEKMLERKKNNYIVRIPQHYFDDSIDDGNMLYSYFTSYKSNKPLYTNDSTHKFSMLDINNLFNLLFPLIKGILSNSNDFINRLNKKGNTVIITDKGVFSYSTLNRLVLDVLKEVYSQNKELVEEFHVATIDELFNLTLLGYSLEDAKDSIKRCLLSIAEKDKLNVDYSVNKFSYGDMF